MYVHQTFKEMGFMTTNHLESNGGEILSGTEMPGGILQPPRHENKNSGHLVCSC